MNSEKPWIFPKIALYFAIVSPFATSFLSSCINRLHFWFLTNRYGKEILIDTDATKKIPFNFDIIPIILSLSIIVLCFLLRKSSEDKKTAGIAFIVSIFMVSIFSVTCPPRYKARQAACMSNMKLIGLAFNMYAYDYDSHLPPLNSNWNSLLKKYKFSNSSIVINNSILHCPNVISTKNPTYSFNKNLAGFNIEKVRNQEDFVIVFESKPGKNLFGSTELLPKYPRHNGGENYCYLDGHTKWIKRDGLDVSKFQPNIEKSK